MTIRLPAIAAVLLSLIAPTRAEETRPPDGRVRLAPYRAVYDLSLLSSRGMRSIEGAQGRIALEFTGNACDGYGLKFRQVTSLQSAESGTKLSDLRTVSSESGDGRTYRFRNDSVGGEGPRTVDGTAERRAGGPLAVRLQRPRRLALSLDGGALFPNAQMRDIIAAAREGRALLPTKLFDGSDDGRKVYETLTVIGHEIGPGQAGGLESPARQEKLAALPRWPVSISYYGPGRADAAPVYVLAFDLYDNGVSRALRLDYGDFALKGDLVLLEMLPERPGCQR